MSEALRERKSVLEAEQSETSWLSNSAIPTKHMRPLISVSEFRRDRLPSPSVSPVATTMMTTAEEREVKEEDVDHPSGFSNKVHIPGKISVHKKLSHSNIVEEGIDPEEARNIRLAIEESLKLSTPSRVGDAAIDRIFGTHDKPGVYRAPRGGIVEPPPSSSAIRQDTEVETSKTELATVLDSRKPVFVVEELKHCVTYPVRYTYDRKNHNQQMHNSFSVLQNGEIDTYYHSEDEDDGVSNEKEIEKSKKNSEIA